MTTASVYEIVAYDSAGRYCRTVNAMDRNSAELAALDIWRWSPAALVTIYYRQRALRDWHFRGQP